MITIDFTHEYEEKTAKPHNYNSFTVPDRTAAVSLDLLYCHACSHHGDLVKAAHQARLAKVARKAKQVGRNLAELPVDVQRYTERPVVTVSVIERYARRIAGLAARG